MFKVAKLEQVKNEKIEIVFGTHNIKCYKDGKSISKEVENISFHVSGDKYVLSFILDCDINRLLSLPMLEATNFNEYLDIGETFFTINNLTDLNPSLDIKITRYLEKQFILFIKLNTEYINYNSDDYSAIIEFEFNIEDYLNKSKF